MNARPDSYAHFASFGITSIMLGFLATVFFFMPVLGIPIALFGLACGLVGLGATRFTRGESLRWSLGGIAFSLLALSVNLAINYAPQGYRLENPKAPTRWQPVPDRPYVAPPA